MPLAAAQTRVAGFHVSDVIAEGWAGRHNGQLLRLMRAAGFDVFVTVDRNLVYQQNIATAGVAVLVLHARSNRIADLRPFAPALLTAIAEAQVGTVPGGVIGVLIGSSTLGMSPELAIYHDRSTLGLRERHVIFVPAVTLHGDLLGQVTRTLRRGRHAPR